MIASPQKTQKDVKKIMVSNQQKQFLFQPKLKITESSPQFNKFNNIKSTRRS